MTLKLFLPIVQFCLLLLACTNQPKEVPAKDSGLIIVTKAQFESEKMEFGTPSVTAFSELVHFTGTIVPSTNGWAQISLPIPGIISKIHCQPGQMVSKDAILFEVTGNELTDMQREFAESAAALFRLKSEYERVKELTKENIGSKKDYIMAESSYLTERARYNSFRLKLGNVGLDVVKIEGDAFYSFYAIQSPINGFVTKINVNIGQYADSQHNAAEIIDPRSFLLKLSVFEKEIGKVKPDQIALFSLAGAHEVTYRAKMISAGKSIHNDSKSIDCYANIEHLMDYNFVSNQFVEGDIIVSTDSVLAVPESAVVKMAGKSYVMQFEKEVDQQFYFNKIEVMTGRTGNDFTELIENLPAGKILVKGTYNLKVE